MKYILVVILIVLSFAACANLKNKQLPVSTGRSKFHQVPLIQGVWEITYTYKNKDMLSRVLFKQTAGKLTGQGADEAGDEWAIQNGQINGSAVSFVKAYTGTEHPLVNYAGELKYVEYPEYTGWMMEGNYSLMTLLDEKPLSDKWIACPVNPLLEKGQAHETGTKRSQENSAGVSQINVNPKELSGRYDVNYRFNFGETHSKMWLKQDGNKLSGDGIDTTTGEKFTISRGWYAHPKVTFIKQYIKGQGAEETRNVTFKAEVAIDGKDITMQGETQLGGSWDACLVR